MPVPSHMLRLRPVRLDVDASEGDAPKWIQVATEGDYKGYAGGTRPFKLDADVFGELVKNFQAHPSYVAGAGGGTARVVPFDFGHASELHPAANAINGAPAQSWALDLAVRPGDDGAELWALTEYLEPAKGYVQGGKILWTSIAIVPEATDPVSGADIGWVLTSIAFTNQPFIQGMTPIAAGMYYGEAATTAGDAIGMIRDILGMPATVGGQDLAGELAKLQAYAATGAPPDGVDVGEIVGKLRRVLNLPLLSEATEVIAQAEMVARATETIPSQCGAGQLPTTATMRTDMSLIKMLAGRFGIPANESEIEAKIVSELDGGKVALTERSALLDALGEDTINAAVLKIGKLIKDHASLQEAMPKLQALAEMNIATEDAAVEDDIEAAIAAHRMPPAAKAAMVALRTGGVALTAETYADAMPRRLAAKAAFVLAYPVAPAAQQHLLQNLSGAAPAADPFAGINVGANGGMTRARPATPQGGGNVIAEHAHGIQLAAGRNITEQAMAYVASRPGGDALTREDQHAQACGLVSQCRKAGLLAVA